MASLLAANVAAAHAALDLAAALDEPLQTAAELVAESLRAGGKLLCCGNGGSAAEAGHLATEFVVRFRDERPALAAIDLTASGANLTAVGNDYHWDEAFSRQIEALGRPGDVLVVFTSSGASPNIERALHTARKLGVRRLAFLGRDGGSCRDLSDVELLVPAQVTARIQEAHLLLLHTLCELVEQRLGLLG